MDISDFNPSFDNKGNFKTVMTLHHIIKQLDEEFEWLWLRDFKTNHKFDESELSKTKFTVLKSYLHTRDRKILEGVREFLKQSDIFDTSSIYGCAHKQALREVEYFIDKSLNEK